MTEPKAVTEAQARLDEVERRVVTGGPVTPGELVEAEAAVRMAERMVATRSAQEAAEAEEARRAVDPLLVAVDAHRRRQDDMLGRIFGTRTSDER